MRSIPALFVHTDSYRHILICKLNKQTNWYVSCMETADRHIYHLQVITMLDTNYINKQIGMSPIWKLLIDISIIYSAQLLVSYATRN